MLIPNAVVTLNLFPIKGQFDVNLYILDLFLLLCVLLCYHGIHGYLTTRPAVLVPPSSLFLNTRNCFSLMLIH